MWLSPDWSQPCDCRAIVHIPFLLAVTGGAPLLYGRQVLEPPVRTSIPAVASAIAGSFAGVAVGWQAGALAARTYDTGENAIVLALLGAGIGSVFGSALGAHWGNGIAGHQPVPFSGRLRDGIVGMMIGALCAYTGSRITSDLRASWRFGYSLGQGFYVGMSNGRW